MSVSLCRSEVSRPARRDWDGALFRLCPLPIVLATYPEGRLLDANGAWDREFGRSADEVLGRTTTELGIWLEEAQRRRFLRKLEQEGEVSGDLAWLVDAHGARRAVELFAERLTVAGEDCVLVTGRDVSQAYYDPLTGLPHRNLIEKRLGELLAEVREAGGMVALLFIDLDRLKGINDSLGHEAGDEVLAAAAHRLRSLRASSDMLARLGGDEFVALLRVEAASEAVQAAYRLLDELRQPLTVAGVTLRPSASIGIAVADGHGEDAGRDLLRFADVAMYRAKRQGGAAVELFDAELDGPEVLDLGLERDLRATLERGGLEVHYQPIVQLRDLAVQGAEALVRWTHPRRGRISPVHFVPLAESTGLISELGRQVLERACADAAGWLRSGVVGPEFSISVNVSASQLQRGRFAHEVSEVLRDTGLPAANLQLEVTERVAVQQAAAARELERLGVRLAVDDFGQGYGSLAYLRTLPVSTLKIDGSFTREVTADPVNYSLVRTMVYMADDLGMASVGEGVETAEQLRCLREIGCRLGQGFLFGEPMPAADFAEVAAAPHPRLRLVQEGGPSSNERTVSRSSPAENGFDRNGVSRPSTPRAMSTSSR